MELLACHIQVAVVVEAVQADLVELTTQERLEALAL
jgi:hypothetical protein